MAARRGKTQARRNSNQGTPGWVWLVAGVAIAAVAFLAAPNLFKTDGDGFLRVGPQPNPDAQPAPVADADVDAATELPRPATRTGKEEDAKSAATQYDFYTLLPGKEVQMSDAELAASAKAEELRRTQQAARAGQSSDAQRAQAALEGRPLPAASPAALPAAVSETPRLPSPVTETAPTRPSQVASVTPATTAAANEPKPAASAPAPASEIAAPTAENVRYILQAGAFGASGDAEATKAKLAMMGLAARVESAQISGKTVYRVRMGPYGTASELAEAKAKLNGSGLQAMAIKAQ
ncbi:MAG: SPOR domain-containing protein [Stenotrophomonas sp.]